MMRFNTVVRIQNVPAVSRTMFQTASQSDKNFLWQIAAESVAQSVKQPETEIFNDTKLKEKYPALTYVSDINRTDATQIEADWRGTGSDLLRRLLPENQLSGKIHYTVSHPTRPSAAVTAALASDDSRKVAIIHPTAQRRMKLDAAFSEMIWKRIDAWFTFDTARQNALGFSQQRSQGVAIGEDGEITATVSTTNRTANTTTANNTADTQKRTAAVRQDNQNWRLQMLEREQMLHSFALSQQFTGIGNTQAAAHLATMMNSGMLQSALGDTIAGIATDEVFRQTRKEVFEQESGYDF